MDSIQHLLHAARQAKKSITLAADGLKQDVLRKLAQKLAEYTDLIIAENKKDLDRMEDADPKKDRLLLNHTRISDLSKSLNDIAALRDPSGKLLSETTTANGLLIQKKSVPLGVVGVIYESRPNVTIDVAALCMRSGNVCVLRGGSDALYTNVVLVSIIHTVLRDAGLDPNIVQLLPTDRKFVTEMLAAVKYIDIIIPRGSQQLINFVRENSLVPTIETGAGVCHTYVEQTADLAKAAAIVVNAKVSRPSVCNSLDTIITDRPIASELLTLAVPGLIKYKVEIFADVESHAILASLNYPYLQKATGEDFGREFLDYKCSVKVVSGYTEAVEHISMYSSKHSEAIITQNELLGEQFINDVDAAAVYINASTRFTDGGVFGLGAEIGISTQKLHARGPFALEKLVTEKWYVRGDGQVR